MINKVILVGNVGSDPEIRTLENGVKMARLRLATSERYTDRQTGEKREHTEWHTVIAWRGLADVLDRYVRKGGQLYVEGKLRTRDYTDQNGIERRATEVLAEEVKLLGKRAEGVPAPIDGTTYGSAPSPAAVSDVPPVPTDDINDLPF